MNLKNNMGTGHGRRDGNYSLFSLFSPGMYFPRFYVLRSWTNLSSEFLKHKVNFTLLCKEKEGDVSFERRSDCYKWILTGDLWHFLSHMREFHRLLQVSWIVSVPKKTPWSSSPSPTTGNVTYGGWLVGPSLWGCGEKRGDVLGTRLHGCLLCVRARRGG